MWYVMQVRTGTEENIRLQCGKMLSGSALSRCFIPYYEEKKKRQGSWKTEQKILFPGYVFLDTEDICQVAIAMKSVVGLTRVLGLNGEGAIPLTEAEEEFLRQFGGEDQIVRMSEGVIEGDRVMIYSGPLKGKEALIKRIDRHKRKAYLEMVMFGEAQKVEVGLEIVMKRV
ncbi:MAG: antiterminator LoaP [Lachnospiraceae bacterium]|nr:antiterminator LoaP [Lachnospiraceae bacterium]